MSWVLDNSPTGESTGQLVLLVLANYARPDGTSAFPAVRTLARATCLSERSVQRKLRELEAAGIIERCDPLIVAAYITRSDSRPIGYNILMSTAPNGVTVCHPVERDGVTVGQHGVTVSPSRGDGVAPEPLLEPSINPSLIIMSNDNLSKLVAPVISMLCHLLADLIVVNGSKRPTVSAAWLKDMDRLIRLDGRTPEQVEHVIRWCQNDSFWQGNIHSPLKLRVQYDKLRLAANRVAKGTEPRGFAGLREFEQMIKDGNA